MVRGGEIEWGSLSFCDTDSDMLSRDSVMVVSVLDCRRRKGGRFTPRSLSVPGRAYDSAKFRLISEGLSYEPNIMIAPRSTALYSPALLSGSQIARK